MQESSFRFRLSKRHVPQQAPPLSLDITDLAGAHELDPLAGEEFEPRSLEVSRD
jgi:hypothetical protein